MGRNIFRKEILIYTNALLKTDPFCFSQDNKDLFLKSAIECVTSHSANPFYKHLLKAKSFSASDLKREEDLAKIPFVMINLLKSYEFLSTERKNISLTLTSSGTGGQKSQIQLDQASLERVKLSANQIYKSLGIIDEKTYNYLCFTYDPYIAKDLGTAFTDELLTTMTKKNEVFYTFKFDPLKNDFFFDEIGTVNKLKEFEKSDLPTRILGFPAHLYFLIEKYNLNLNLGEDSWLQTGGGWKGHDDKQIPKPDFRELIQKKIGIRKDHNRDLFGMVEHGIAYVDDKEGRLRVPNYSRVFIRDPKTLEILDYGEVGLIQFLCTYNHSYASFNVLSTDWGVLEKDDAGEVLTIIGRAGIKKHKGCAISANSMIGK